MLNVNSPTVQAMMQNVPQGFGNMPVYFGNTPTVTTEQVPQNQTQFSTPYPSPKEMLMQSGQQNVYAPTSFAPRNIVGAYNPGYQAAFNGYINPYIGYGTYGGYGYSAYPMDEETRQTLELANLNGLDYEEQVKMESDLYKKMSRTVSKNLDRSEEDAQKCESAFEPRSKSGNQPQPIIRDAVKTIHIRILVNDEVVADIPSRNTGINNNAPSSSTMDNLRARDAMIRTQIANRMNDAYANAIERKMDNMDMLDFFNNGAGSIISANIEAIAQYQNATRSAQLYNKERFGQRLLENNGIKRKSQKNAIERFVGRYGVMPDGRPVSPGHDPAVAQSFSYDPNTGQYSVTAPNFIRDRMEKARQSFINSIS